MGVWCDFVAETANIEHIACKGPANHEGLVCVSGLAKNEYVVLFAFTLQSSNVPANRRHERDFYEYSIKGLSQTQQTPKCTYSCGCSAISIYYVVYMFIVLSGITDMLPTPPSKCGFIYIVCVCVRLLRTKWRAHNNMCGLACVHNKYRQMCTHTFWAEPDERSTCQSTLEYVFFALASVGLMRMCTRAHASKLTLNSYLMLQHISVQGVAQSGRAVLLDINENAVNSA